MHLSKRLQCIAAFIKKGDKVIDIGTDHALLPIHLVSSGIVEQVIASDLNKGPFMIAKSNIAQMDLDSFIHIRLGNGLTVVTPGEVDTVTVAGMGGGTIKAIFEASPLVMKQVKKIVIQPMTDEDAVRLWVNENRWQIFDEEILEEDDKIYTVIAAQPGITASLSKEEILFGPCLLKKKPQLLKTKLLKTLEHQKSVLAQIAKSGTANTKYQQLANEIQVIEGVLGCL